MTPQDLTNARHLLGLTAADLGRRLELEGRDPGRYVRAYETAQHPIPGPVRVAVRLMLEAHARQTLQEALHTAEAILAPPAPATPLQAPETRNGVDPIRTRRRG